MYVSGTMLVAPAPGRCRRRNHLTILRARTVVPPIGASSARETETLLAVLPTAKVPVGCPGRSGCPHEGAGAPPLISTPRRCLEIDVGDPPTGSGWTVLDEEPASTSTPRPCSPSPGFLSCRCRSGSRNRLELASLESVAISIAGNEIASRRRAADRDRRSWLTYTPSPVLPTAAAFPGALVLDPVAGDQVEIGRLDRDADRRCCLEITLQALHQRPCRRLWFPRAPSMVDATAGIGIAAGTGEIGADQVSLDDAAVETRLDQDARSRVCPKSSWRQSGLVPPITVLVSAEELHALRADRWVELNIDDRIGPQDRHVPRGLALDMDPLLGTL